MTPTIYFIVLVIVLGTLALGWSFYRRQQRKPALEPGGTSRSVSLPGKQVGALRTRLSYALVALPFVGLTLLLFPQPQALAASAQQLTNRGSYAQQYTNVGYYLTTGQYLSTNDYLESPNGQFFAIMQSDGNFVLYRGSGPSNNFGAYWATNTYGKSGGQFFATIQSDGNFCLYPGPGPSHTLNAIWCSRHSSLPTGQFWVVMQDDGNFCTYHGTGPSNNLGNVWCSGPYPAVTTFSIVAGNNQSQFLADQAGFSEKTALFAPLQVKVLNRNGTPASGVQVSFKVGSAPSGMQIDSYAPATVTTDANGIATYSWLDQLDYNYYSVACHAPFGVSPYTATGPFTIVASDSVAQVTFNETVTS
jgi:hypothetical protein